MSRLRLFVALISMLLLATLLATPASAAWLRKSTGALTSGQRANLMKIARDTWSFYKADVDPNTHLPMDNITYAGGSPTPTAYGRYTSAANIGVYLWAVVAAQDLGLIGRPEAVRQISATLSEVARLKRDHGFLYQWYDTTSGNVILNPGQADCSVESTPAFDNCYFISNVDNGWYASGLIVVRSAFPNLRQQVNRLMAPMDFGLFYDARPQTHCNTNPTVTGNQPTGQMFGGYYVGLPPDANDNWIHYYHNGALYSDPRISAYIGMGLHQMPGDVWWRSWRVLPPKAPFADCQATDPDFSWQGQWPHPGYWTVYRDPQSGKDFNVWEGHYTYLDNNPTFIPSFAGGMFEGLMANEVVPETTWGPRSFGLADVRTPQVQIKYTTEQLHYPVWGMSPSSTADDSGGYGGFGVEGLTFPYYGFGADENHPNKGLSQCHGCATEDVVTPHASFLALDVAPQQAYANIQALRAHYPGVYGSAGFFDAVNPTTGSVGHRILVLDHSMIMAALDNALADRAMQQHFAKDPVSWAARLYLSYETMSIQ
jgi:Putative glucoamylase/Protein of unknown function (DUF3131)